MKIISYEPNYECRNLYSEKAYELINIIKQRFVNNDGYIARSFPPTSRTLLDNLDDIVPFFLYFGEADFLLEQVHKVQKKGDGLISLCSSHGMLRTRQIDEWFGGLYAIWKATRDASAFDLLSESVKFVHENLIYKNNLSGAYNLCTGKSSPYYESWSSGLLEVFAEMRDDFPDLFDTSMMIMRNWIRDEYFAAYGLFPYRVFSHSLLNAYQKLIASKWIESSNSQETSTGGRITRLSRHFRFQLHNGWYSQLMKSNSTSAFALLEFYRSTKDEFWKQSLIRWCENALQSFVVDGLVYSEYYPMLKKATSPSISPAFILVDVICDGSWWIPEMCKYLPVAKSILDTYWQKRLPDGVLSYNFKRYAHIDSQVDFSVSLRKFAEVSGDVEYLHRAKELMDLALNLFYSPNGYWTYFGDLSESNLIDPKYNALFLKGLINVMTIEQNSYNNTLHGLFKDR